MTKIHDLTFTSRELRWLEHYLFKDYDHAVQKSKTTAGQTYWDSYIEVAKEVKRALYSTNPESKRDWSWLKEKKI